MEGAADREHLDGHVARSREAFVSALGAGDARRAAAMYAVDARMLLPSGESMDGRAAIEAFWRVGLDAGMTAISLAPNELVVEATFACESGRYVMSVAPPHEAVTEQRGRYLTVLRRQSAGAWLRALEIFDPELGAGD